MTDARDIAPADGLPAIQQEPAVSRVPETRKPDDNAAPAARAPVKFLGVAMPGPITNFWHGFEDWGTRTRQKALKAAPPGMVNNSSNIIAGMHMIAEAFMFKASGKQLILDSRKNNPINFIIDPPRNIWNSTLGDAWADGFRLTDLVKPRFYKNGIRDLLKLEDSTMKDLAALKPGEAMHNRWQSRATLTGVIGWSLSFATPDYKEKTEDVERYAEMAVRNPLLYVGTRIKQAVFFPVETVVKLAKKAADPKSDQEIGKNKAAYTGLGVIIYGIWSTIGAWRNVGTVQQGEAVTKGYEWLSKLRPGQKYYYFNPMYLATGLVSIFAGVPLIFGTNSERNWVGFGSHMQLRMPFLFFSIKKQFAKGGPGAWWYTGGHAIFQTHNAVSWAIGGAKKVQQPDGSYVVVDHADESKAAKEKAIQEKHAEQKQPETMADADEPAKPDARISHANVVERLAAGPQLQAEGV